MSVRTDFEIWYSEKFADDPNSIGALSEWLAYQAATERAAKLVEQVGPKDGSLALVTAAFAAAIRAGGEQT